MDKASPHSERAAWARVHSWTKHIPGYDAPLAPEEEAIVQELRAVGVPLRHLSELYNSGLRYDKAVPILLKHVVRAYPRYIREGLVRCLTLTNIGMDVHRTLVDVLKKDYAEFDEQGVFALGNAIAVTAPRRQFDDLVEIALDPKYTAARYMPATRIAKSADPRKCAVVERFFHDYHYPGPAIQVARVAKMWSLADGVARYENSENEFVRAEARKFFRAKEKAERGASG